MMSTTKFRTRRRPVGTPGPPAGLKRGGVQRQAGYKAVEGPARTRKNQKSAWSEPGGVPAPRREHTPRLGTKLSFSLVNPGPLRAHQDRRRVGCWCMPGQQQDEFLPHPFGQIGGRAGLSHSWRAAKRAQGRERPRSPNRLPPRRCPCRKHVVDAETPCPIAAGPPPTGDVRSPTLWAVEGAAGLS